MNFFNHLGVVYIMKKTTVLILALFFSNIIYAKTTNPYELIQKLGFSPFKSGMAKEFSLLNLDGKLKSLSSYRGKWVVLNFWATWCGPCVEKMPMMESVHQELKDKNFVMLGISIDSGTTYPIKKFAKKYGITFEILHDRNSLAARRYGATAVPITFLITPMQRLIGVYHGGKNWESDSAISTFKELVSLKGVSQSDYDNQKNVDKVAVAQEKLTPPDLAVVLTNEIFKGGRDHLQVHVYWKGDPRKYVVKVPKIELPKEIEQGVVASSSMASTGTATLTYHYQLTFNEVGTYRLGPITMAFTSKFGGEPQFSRHPGIDIEVKKIPIAGVAIKIFVIILVLGAIVFIVLRMNRKSPQKIEESSKELDLENRLKEIKKMRMDGKLREYTTLLLKLNKEILQARGEDSTSLDQQIEKIQYGGDQLPSEKLNYYEKQIENEYKELDNENDS